MFSSPQQSKMRADISDTLWKNNEKFQFCPILVKSKQDLQQGLKDQATRSMQEGAALAGFEVLMGMLGTDPPATSYLLPLHPCVWADDK